MARYDGRLPRSYNESMRYLGGRESKKVLGNTYLFDNGNGSTLIEYHGNGIARFAEDEVIINSHGYCGPSTRDRLNAIAPGNVRFGQKNFEPVIYINGEVRRGSIVRVDMTSSDVEIIG